MSARARVEFPAFGSDEAACFEMAAATIGGLTSGPWRFESLRFSPEQKAIDGEVFVWRLDVVADLLDGTDES